LMADDRSRQAVEIAEQHADGLQPTHRLSEAARGVQVGAAWCALLPSAWEAAWHTQQYLASGHARQPSREAVDVAKRRGAPSAAQRAARNFTWWLERYSAEAIQSWQRRCGSGDQPIPRAQEALGAPLRSEEAREMAYPLFGALRASQRPRRRTGTATGPGRASSRRPMAPRCPGEAGSEPSSAQPQSAQTPCPAFRPVLRPGPV
jgi:hypothetical protein